MKVLVALLLTAAVAAADSYSVGGTGRFLFQEAHPSKSSLSGWIFGGDSIHEAAYYFDTLSIAGGLLHGKDSEEEPVRARYIELECKLCFKLRYGLLTPYAGAGFRIHWFNFREPAVWGQDVEYLYLPLGVRIEETLRGSIQVGALLEADLIAFGKWRYAHPLFSAEFRPLNPRPGCDAALWIRQGAYFAALTLRYIPFSFPEEMLFAPESKTQLTAGVKMGAEWFY